MPGGKFVLTKVETGFQFVLNARNGEHNRSVGRLPLEGVRKEGHRVGPQENAKKAEVDDQTGSEPAVGSKTSGLRTRSARAR